MAGTSAVRLGLRGFVRLNGSFIVRGGFALHERDRAGGAGGQAVAEAVAVVVAHQFGFAVDHCDGAFVACRRARAAAVAFFFVDVNDFPDHEKIALSFILY